MRRKDKVCSLHLFKWKCEFWNMKTRFVLCERWRKVERPLKVILIFHFEKIYQSLKKHVYLYDSYINHDITSTHKEPNVLTRSHSLTNDKIAIERLNLKDDNKCSNSDNNSRDNKNYEVKWFELGTTWLHMELYYIHSEISRTFRCNFPIVSEPS